MWHEPTRKRKNIIATLLFLVLIAMVVVCGLWGYRQYRMSPPNVDKEKYPVRGIDVSRHNGDIDFGEVAARGIDFVFIKASEGITHRDSLYKRNFTQARKAGLKTGAYHFFRFDREGVPQAENFLEAVAPETPDLGLVIDVEKSGNPSNIDPEEVKRRLLDMVEYMVLSGHRVMLYTNIEGYYEYISETLPGYPLWICRFQEYPINAEWTFWQYDHHGSVPGISGDVDLNVFCGSRDDWERYLSGSLYPYEE